MLPVAALLTLSGCKALDPVALYRAATQQLHFSLEKVDPKLELAFPLDRSKIRLNLNLGVENRSSLRLASRVLGGKLHLDQDGVSRAIGFVSFPQGVDLAPSAKSSTGAEIALTYADLKDLWEPLMAVVKKKKGGTFRLDGEAQLDVMGFPVKVPLRASKRTGE
jgi:hypothetical protein